MNPDNIQNSSQPAIKKIDVTVAAVSEEKYAEIKAKLENETPNLFPSIFQQARDVMKQAWTSGIEATKGKPLLADAEKAAQRLEICNSCEFLKNNRCVLCGCFMSTKIHIDGSTCPSNKWGENLQRMLSQEHVNKYMQSYNSRIVSNMTTISSGGFSTDEQKVFDRISQESLKYGGRFLYKGENYQASVGPEGNTIVQRLSV